MTTNEAGPAAPAPARPRHEVAEVFRLYGDAYRQTHRLSTPALRVMHAIETCRTAALGGHLERCTDCGFERPAYDSCRNRHCPTCQSLATATWLEARRAELLPVNYFHTVFTVPAAHALVSNAHRHVMTRPRTLRTVWIMSHASRDGTRVAPALVTRPEDSACDACASLADRGSRRRSPAPTAVAHAAVSPSRSSSTPASIQSPSRGA